MGNDREYRWKVKSPLGLDVICMQDTFSCHLQNEDTRTEKEIEHLLTVEDNVKSVVSKPRFIYCDRNYEINLRHNYIDLVNVPNMEHLQALVVVVDTDRIPNEVVTWTIKRNLKQEKGEVIYDSKRDS